MPCGFAVPFALAVIATLQNPQDSASRHSSAPRLRAAQVQGPKTVDGKLDEGLMGCRRAGNIGLARTRPGRRASSRPKATEVRVLIGEDALYIGARLYDREPNRVKAALARRDDDVEGDEFDVYLDTFHDHLSGVRFRVTPGGAILDGILAHRPKAATRTTRGTRSGKAPPDWTRWAGPPSSGSRSLSSATTPRRTAPGASSSTARFCVRGRRIGSPSCPKAISAE